MSMKYLGETIDIHGGGLDNLFPHHECEIAQSESVTGKPFVRYWLHNNMCTVDGQKMAKSLGNGILIQDALNHGHPLLESTYEACVVRQFILTSHYRATLDFSDDSLKAARSGSMKLREAFGALRKAARQAPEKPVNDAVRSALADIERRFADSMNDDFNGAAALAVLYDFARQAGAWVEQGIGRDDLIAADVLAGTFAGDVLGLAWPETRASAADVKLRDGLMQLLIDIRNDARAAKNFGLADQVRKRLFELDVELRDGPQGTTWKAAP
jgi:cysteinyl-tRNA synthetase